MNTSYETDSLPKNWSIAELNRVSEILAGGPAPQGEEFFVGGELPFVRVQDMGRLGEEIYLSTTNDLINENGAKKLKLFPKGSVLFTKSGASTLNNQRAILSRDSYVVSHIGVLLPKGDISNKWIYFWLKGVDFKKLAHSTVMPSLPLSKISSLFIPIPPIYEQHRIVAKIEALFSELDKGIESFKTAREQLKIYRQALLKHAFSGKLTEQWRAENAGKLESAEALLQRIQTERQQRYQQQLKDWEDKSPSIPLLQRGKPDSKLPKIPPFEKGGLGGISKPKAPKTLPPLTAEELAELPELPKGWVYSRLGALIDEPTYGTAKKCDYEVDGIGVLRIPNVVSGKINASDLKFAQFDADERASYKLDVGDILLIRSNGSISIVGKCALVSEQDINYLYAGYLIKLRPNQVLIASTYLVNQLAAHSLRKQIEAKAKSTSGVNNINSGEIQSLIVALCGVEEQQKVLTEVETNLSIIDQLDQTITTALQQAEALRQSILKKAFSGQLVPQDPNDEPASVLLERIRAEQAVSDKPKTRKTKHA